MKIELKKLNTSAHASIPFDETIDLTDEKLSMARSRFQSPVHIKGVVSNESGVVGDWRVRSKRSTPPNVHAA